MSYVVADKLCVSLGKTPVLLDVSVAFEQGKLVGILGANGAGKSTLVRTLIGFLRPDRGSIELDGRAINQLSDRSRAKQLGYVAQNHNIHWPLAVRQVVELGRMPHRSGFAALQASDHRAVDAAMDFVGIRALQHRPCDCLSGGERARVLVARALAGEPRFLLADEPLAGLDPSYQLLLMQSLLALAQQGLGVAVVMHDITLAARFCDVLVLLAHGRVIATGTPAEVIQPQNMLAAYGMTVKHCTSSDGAQAVIPWQVISK